MTYLEKARKYSPYIALAVGFIATFNYFSRQSPTSVEASFTSTPTPLNSPTEAPVTAAPTQLDIVVDKYPEAAGSKIYQRIDLKLGQLPIKIVGYSDKYAAHQ